MQVAAFLRGVKASIEGGGGGGGRGGGVGGGDWSYECPPQRPVNSHAHCFLSLPSTYYTDNPTTNGGTQNVSSVGIRTRCMHAFARLASDSHARSVLH